MGKARLTFPRIAKTIGLVIGHSAALDFISRLAFTIVTGNGDMHLKNWSLIYPDGRNPELAPAYDLVSTVAYIPNDRLALGFLKEKSFSAINLDSFRNLAKEALISSIEAIERVERVIELVSSKWPEISLQYEIPSEIARRIGEHISKVTLR